MAAAPDLKKLQQSLQSPPTPEPTAGPFEDAFNFLHQQVNPDPGLLDRAAELQHPQPTAPPPPDPRQQAIKYASDQFIAGLSPDNESLQPLSPYYDEPRLTERMNSVIYTARQVTGGVLRPEVAWDLARSGLDMNQVTGVLRYMLEQSAPAGQETSLAHPYLTDAEVKAHLLAPTADDLPGLQSKVHRDEEADLAQQYFPQVANAQSPAAATPAGGFVPAMIDLRKLWSWAGQVQTATDNFSAPVISWLAHNAGEAWKWSLDSSDPEKGLTVSQGGQLGGASVVPGVFVPPQVQEIPKGSYIEQMGIKGPVVGDPFRDPPGETPTSGEILHGMAVYYDDPTIEERKGTWDAQTIQQFQEYMNAMGNAFYQKQVAVQSAHYAGDLTPNGVINPDTEVGKKWIQAITEYETEKTAELAEAVAHPGNAPTDRDSPVLAAIHAWQEGDSARAGKLLQHNVLPTGDEGLPGGLLSVLRLAQIPFAPFEWALQAQPETANFTAEVARDPRYAALIRQAIAEGKLVPPGKTASEGMTTNDWQWAEANIRDPSIVNQLHQIVLDKLQVFGLGGDPELQSFGTKHLGSVTELIANAIPYKPTSDAMVEWAHDHPVAESITSAGLMLAAPVPKFGTLMKLGLGEERYYSVASRLPGGLNPYLTKRFVGMSTGAREPEQVTVARMTFSGKVSGHYRGLTLDQESRLGISSPEEAMSQRANAMFGPNNDVWADTPTKGVGTFLNDLAKSEVPHYQVGPTSAAAIGVHGERSDEQIVADTLAHGGTSYQPKYQLSPVVGAKGAGWMVGIDKAKGVSVPKDVLSPQHIADFKANNAEAWKDQRNFVGTEVDAAGNVNLDVARHTYNKNEAHALGVQHEQERVFDIATGESPKVSRRLANQVRAGRGHPAGSGGPEGGQASGEVLLQSERPGRGGAGGEAGPTGAISGRSTVRIRAQNLRQLTALRGAVERARAAGRDVKLTVNGRAATEVPMPVHIPTKQEYSDMIHSVLTEVDRRLPGQIVTRPGLYARMNQAIVDHSWDPNSGWLIRSLAQKAYSGSLNYRDPSTIDKVISITNNYIRDEATRRRINAEFRTAYREGSAGSNRFDNANHLLHDAIDRYNLTPEGKASSATHAFEAKGGWSAGEDEETGRPRFESIYDNAKKHEAYMSSLERAVPRKPGPEAEALASKRLDSPSAMTLENISYRLNQLVKLAVRWPATVWSAGLQTKVALMDTRKILTGEIPGGLKFPGRLETRDLGSKTKAVMEQPELARLRFTHRQDFANNAPAHFADYNKLDNALVVGLDRLASASVYGVNKKIRNMKLSEVMTPEQIAAYEASLRMTVATSGERLKELERQEIPAGPKFKELRGQKAALHQAINRAAYDRDAIKANRLPASVAEPLIEKAYREWLQSPGGIDFQKASFSNADGTLSGSGSKGELWTQEKIDRHVSAAMQQVNGQFVNYPEVHKAFLAGAKGKELLKVAARNGELADRGSKASTDFWFSHDVPTEKSFLAGMKDAAGSFISRTSYYEFKRTKFSAYDRFTEANLEQLWPEVEAGRMTAYDAGFLAMQKAHDQTYEALFNLQLSMTNAEQRLRFMAPFATKMRLYFTDLARTMATDPRYGAAINNLVTTFNDVNANQNQYNKYRVSFTTPFAIPGIAKAGDRIDFHLDNAFWLGPNHELLNAAIPQYLQDQFGLNPYDPVLGYDTSARNPYGSFFPRVGQEVEYMQALAIANGLTGVAADQRTNAAIDSLPALEQNYVKKRANTFIYLHALQGEDVSVDDAVRTAIAEELHFSTIKVTTPLNLGVVSADQVAVEQQLKALRAVTNHQQLVDLENQYPQITELFHLTEDPHTFKEFVMGQAGYTLIKQQYQDSLQHIESTWGPAALIVGASGWREAGQEYADANNARNDAIASLAKSYPAWGAFRGFVYQDAKGNWVTKDEGMSIIRQRESVLQSVKKQWSQFKDDNLILPGSAKDREQVATAVNNYDDLIGLLRERDKIKNPTPDQVTVTKELGKALFQFQQDFGDILDTYRPQASGNTTLRDVKKSYFDNVYTPFFNAQTPIFKRLDDPLITSKEKGVLLDQLRNLKDTMNLSYVDPNFPGVKLPPPEQHQFAAWDPVVQAQHVATWRYYAAHKPEWLTDWQTKFLQDPSMLAEAVKGWDSTATKAYLDTLVTLQDRGGFSGGGFRFAPVLSAGEKWRLNLKARGLTGPNVIAGRVPTQVNPHPGNILAPNAPAVFPRGKSGKLKH